MSRSSSPGRQAGGSGAPGPTRKPPVRRSEASPRAPRLVSCTVEEDAVVCPTGGGFENVTWLVQVNNAWLSVADLLKGRLGGNVTADLVDGHDPNGLESSGTIPPQCSFHRRTNIVAPIGTQFRKLTIRPVIDRNKTFQDYLLAGETFVRRKTFEQIFVLRGEDRLVLLTLDEERRSQPRVPASEPLTREQTQREAKAVLSLLERGAPQHSSKR